MTFKYFRIKFKDSFLKVFYRTYPCSRMSSVTGYMDGKPVGACSYSSLFITSWVTILTSFLGLPNYFLLEEFKYGNLPSNKGIALVKSFFGWGYFTNEQPEKLRLDIFSANVLVALMVTPWHLLMFFPTLINNVLLKPFTELLWGVGYILFEIAGSEDVAEDMTDRALAYMGYGLFRLLHSMGCALTSPVKNIFMLWKNAHRMGEKIAGNNYAGMMVGYVLAFTAVMLSLAFTLFIHSFFASLIFPSLGIIPEVIRSGVEIVGYGLGSNALMPMFMPLAGLLGITLAPEAAGLAVMISLALISAASPFFGRDYYRWWKQIRANKGTLVETVDETTENDSSDEDASYDTTCRITKELGASPEKKKEGQRSPQTLEAKKDSKKDSKLNAGKWSFPLPKRSSDLKASEPQGGIRCCIF